MSKYQALINPPRGSLRSLLYAYSLDNNILLDDLAAKIGLVKSHLSAMLRGKERMSVATAVRIERAFTGQFGSAEEWVCEQALMDLHEYLRFEDIMS